MNVLAIYAVNEHIADLMAEADQERKLKALRARNARKARSTGFVASIRAALRGATLSPAPRAHA